jgi:hypothetical protein
MWWLPELDPPVAIHVDMGLSYREWGYVLWDLDRLQGTIDGPWMPTTVQEPRHTPVDIIDKIVSCYSRAKIYRLGGRGWWDHTDETQIIWPPGYFDEAFW